MSRATIIIRREIVADENPDSSYLEQAEFKERHAEYLNGDFSFVGVRAVAEIKIPYGADWIISEMRSPGLWGIESDSGEDYFAEVFEQEAETLVEMLEALHDYALIKPFGNSEDDKERQRLWEKYGDERLR